MSNRFSLYIVVLGWLALSATVRGDIVLVSHNGSNDPLTENMVFVNGVNGVTMNYSNPTPGQLNQYGSVGPTTLNGTNAWMVNDTSPNGSSSYGFLVNPAQAANGWTMSTTVTVANTSLGARDQLLLYQTATTQWGLWFGLANNVLQAAEFTPTGYNVVFMALDANFHSFALTYNPTTGKAAVTADGNVVDPTYAGGGSGPSDINNYVGFGAGSTANEGTGYYSAFSFATPSSVPEPSSWMLGAMAALSLAGGGWKWCKKQGRQDMNA